MNQYLDIGRGMYTLSIVEHDMFSYEQMMSYCVLHVIPDKVTCF